MHPVVTSFVVVLVAWKASPCFMFAHPKLMGGFQICFHFHPKFQDFRIMSNSLKFQDSVRYLLKAKRCFCEKSSGSRGAITRAVWPLLSGQAFSCSVHVLQPDLVTALVAKVSGQAVLQLSVPTSSLRTRRHPPPIGTRLHAESARSLRGYLHSSGRASLLEGGNASEHTLFLVLCVHTYA